VLTGLTTREEEERFPYRPSRIVESVADLIGEISEPAGRPSPPQ
jgi:NagD protein